MTWSRHVSAEYANPSTHAPRGPRVALADEVERPDARRRVREVAELRVVVERAHAEAVEEDDVLRRARRVPGALEVHVVPAPEKSPVAKAPRIVTGRRRASESVDAVVDADAPERARAEDRRARRARRGATGGAGRAEADAMARASSDDARDGDGTFARAVRWWRARAIARGATNRAGEEIGEPTKSPRFAPAGGRASRDLHFLDMEKQCTKKATAPRIICARVSSTTAPPRWFWRLAARSTRSPSPGTPRRAPTSSRATLTRATNEDRRSWVSLPAAAAGIRSACRDDRVRHPPPPTRADSS